jgi:hypothetical protein
VERISQNNENVRVIENSGTTVSGNPGIKLVIAHGEKEYAAKTTQILTIYGNLAYVLQYDGSGESYEANLPTARRVFDSVEIVPPVSRAQTLSLTIAGVCVALAAVTARAIRKRNAQTLRFLWETKRLFPSSFGLELLCVASAEIGGLLGLWYFGFNAFGIMMAYLLAYGLAGLTTFLSILGRSAYPHGVDDISCGCVGMVEHSHNLGFRKGIKQSFANLAIGLKMICGAHAARISRGVIKTSLIMLLSAESGCIVAAATVDILMYQYSIFLSIPMALIIGTLTVATMAAYRNAKTESLVNQSHF